VDEREAKRVTLLLANVIDPYTGALVYRPPRKKDIAERDLLPGWKTDLTVVDMGKFAIEAMHISFIPVSHFCKSPFIEIGKNGKLRPLILTITGLSHTDPSIGNLQKFRIEANARPKSALSSAATRRTF